jgi:hypothetical protein
LWVLTCLGRYHVRILCPFIYFSVIGNPLHILYWLLVLTTKFIKILWLVLRVQYCLYKTALPNISHIFTLCSSETRWQTMHLSHEMFSLFFLGLEGSSFTELSKLAIGFYWDFVNNWFVSIFRFSLYLFC